MQHVHVLLVLLAGADCCKLVVSARQRASLVLPDLASSWFDCKHFVQIRCRWACSALLVWIGAGWLDTHAGLQPAWHNSLMSRLAIRAYHMWMAEAAIA